jgi:polyisoprenyl-phosphate glycosyltransferase
VTAETPTEKTTTMSQPSLRVVCPVYREAESISDFHKRLWDVLGGLGNRYDISVQYVIDPSDDETVAIVRDLIGESTETSALVMSNRFGHQMALLAGMDDSNSDVLITLDCDLQHPPELLPALLEKYEEGYDVVQTIRTSTENQSRIGRFLSSRFYRLLNKLSDTKIVDGGADFRLLSRRVVNVFKNDLRERNQFLRGLIPWIGFRSCQVEFTADQRHGGQSKYSFARSLRLATDGLVSFSKAPLRLGVGIGLFFAVGAFAYALATGIVWVTNGSIPPGWASLAMLVAGSTGVLLAFMGILGLYIGAIFDEVKARPHYIVAERIGRENVV